MSLTQLAMLPTQSMSYEKNASLNAVKQRFTLGIPDASKEKRTFPYCFWLTEKSKNQTAVSQFVAIFQKKSNTTFHVLYEANLREVAP